MPTEPTILHVTGADLDARHDAAVIFIDHQGARVRFLDGVDFSAVTAAHLDLSELHNKFRVRDNSLVGGFGRSHPDDTPALCKVVTGGHPVWEGVNRWAWLNKERVRQPS